MHGFVPWMLLYLRLLRTSYAPALQLRTLLVQTKRACTDLAVLQVQFLLAQLEEPDDAPLLFASEVSDIALFATNYSRYLSNSVLDSQETRPCGAMKGSLGSHGYGMALAKQLEKQP